MIPPSNTEIMKQESLSPVDLTKVNKMLVMCRAQFTWEKQVEVNSLLERQQEKVKRSLLCIWSTVPGFRAMSENKKATVMPKSPSSVSPDVY